MYINDLLYTDQYATHQYFLEWYVNKTDGDILEFGCGDTSTSIIMNCIKYTNRKLISIENNREWYEKVIKRYPPNDQHIYIFVENDKEYDETIQQLTSHQFSVVFIDQSPWESRVTALNAFKDIADYIMVHDVDYYPRNNIFGTVIDKDTFQYDFSDVFNKWKLYYPYQFVGDTGPPTLVGTNKEQYTEIDPLILGMCLSIKESAKYNK